jgi:hypothetical protein
MHERNSIMIFADRRAMRMMLRRVETDFWLDKVALAAHKSKHRLL